MGKEDAGQQVFFRLRLRARKTIEGVKPSYVLEVHDNFGLAFTVPLRNWWPVIDYLRLDQRYAHRKDYIVMNEAKYSPHFGRVTVPKIRFLNPDCEMRTAVYALSILGVDDIRFWIDRMEAVVRKLGPIAISFWYYTARDRYHSIRDSLKRRYALLRVAKSMRRLYGAQ